MNISRYIVLPALLSIVAILPACQTSPDNSTFGSSQAGRAQRVEKGEVTHVRAVTIQNDSRTLGTATGAVLGGIAGSAIGGGTRANAAGAVAGAAAGGAVGNRVAGRSTEGVEVTVRLDSGRSIAVVQAGSPNEFRVGDHVRVMTDGATTRVAQ